MSADEKKGATLREYIDSLLVTIILALFGTTFIVQAFKIPSSSMENTLLVGDHLLVNKFVFADQPGAGWGLLPYRPVHRGDVIVFKYPFPPYQHFVKRVIGVPGDHLKLVNRQVFINDQPLKEPYARYIHPEYQGGFPDNFPPPKGVFPYGMLSDWADQLPGLVTDGELIIPPGKYFAMGDNRENSQDSRYWGLVDRSNIVGRPLLIYWSYDSRGHGGEDEPGRSAASGWDEIAHIFTRTRWHRFLHVVH